MSNVSKYCFILKKILFSWNKKSKFRSILNILSIFITVCSLSFILISLSINQGFKSQIVRKIIDIDGYGRIHNINNLSFDKNNINESIISTNLLTQEILVKFSGSSEGSLLNAYDDSGQEVFKLNQYIIEGQFNGNGIIVGEGLSSKLKVNIDDEVFLINMDNDKVNLLKIKVSGIFKTNIPYYDNYLIYTKIHFVKDFINKSNFNSSVVLSHRNSSYKPNNVDISNLFKDYKFTSWKQRHSSFTEWLFAYDIPIKFLLLFVLIISMLNIVSSTYIDLTLSKDENIILYIMGFNIKDIKYLYLIKNVIISIIGSLLSIFIYFGFNFLNNNFTLIEIPKEIYYTEKIPFEINGSDFLVVFFYIIIIAIASTVVSFKNSLSSNNIDIKS